MAEKLHCNVPVDCTEVTPDSDEDSAIATYAQEPFGGPNPECYLHLERYVIERIMEMMSEISVSRAVIRLADELMVRRSLSGDLASSLIRSTIDELDLLELQQRFRFS